MNVEIANRLYELRKKSGLSQEELADRLGVTRQSISKWERAEASPDTDNLILLSKIYNVSLDELLYSEDIEIENLKAENEELKKENKCLKENKKTSKLKMIIDATIWLVATITFLLVGFFTGLWHPYWTIFLMAICITSLTEAIDRKRASYFCYPVFMVVLFILLGHYTGAWHPLWVLFITIPIFYTITEILKKGKNNDDDEDDDEKDDD